MVGNQKTGKVAITTRFEVDDFQKLRELAFRRDMTPNALAAAIVKGYLDELNDSAAAAVEDGRL